MGKKDMAAKHYAEWREVCERATDQELRQMRSVAHKDNNLARWILEAVQDESAARASKQSMRKLNHIAAMVPVRGTGL